MKGIFVITAGDVIAFSIIGVGALAILGLFAYGFIYGKIKSSNRRLWWYR